MKMRNDHTDVGSEASRDGATKGTALAPSQHIRSMPGTTRAPRTPRRSFAAAPLVLLLGATLALSGCGTQQASTAAIVDGTPITEQAVQSVSRQQDVTSSTALLGLILAPYVFAEGNRVRQSASDVEVLAVIDKVSKPSLATAQFVRTRLVLEKLTPASQITVVNELSKAKITVNPRYGTFKALLGLVPNNPNWIKAGTSAEAR
jgi:hypothetical protein